MRQSVYKEPRYLNRFNSYINKVSSGCWEWTSTISWKGYGTFCIMKNLVSFNTNAHRVSYIIHKGNIRKGLTVHHKCHNKKCVNPDHLELKTNRQNRLEGNCWSAINARKTHCKRGHEFNKRNIYIAKRKDGRTWRCCRKCRKMHSKLFTENKRRIINKVTHTA